MATLRLPEGDRAGELIDLAEFQVAFIKAAFAEGVDVGLLSVGRGSGKTMLGAGLALGHLVGAISPMPGRQAILAAKVRDQAAIAWSYARGLAASLPVEIQKRIRWKRSPVLSAVFTDDDGREHELRCVPSDGKNTLGLAPSFILLDERGHWDGTKGDALERALMSAAGKKRARTIMISTSAPDDGHTFSRWLDNAGDGVFAMEFRAPDEAAVDSDEAILTANPLTAAGAGMPLDWLRAEAKRAATMGGTALRSFELFNLNKRVSEATRDVVCTPEAWAACETETPPPRSGWCVLGVDLGGAASMSAAAVVWESGRVEVVGAFPRTPSLAERGLGDAVGARYQTMAERGELVQHGERIVDVGAFLGEVLRGLDGENIVAVCSDRYRQGEAQEAFAAAGLTVAPTWRGEGWRDGGEDLGRLQRAIADRSFSIRPSLLLRSAIEGAVVLRDDAMNGKLSKYRSRARIDALTALKMAVAEAARRRARPAPRAARVAWA
ncbi:MAG: terminase [Pseudomonadota bacterium]